jgi:putative sigma-54 modulation protein
MDVTIRGRNITVTERIEEYVKKKVSKLSRYLSTIDEARMELAAENTRSAQDSQVAQLTVRSRGAILRAEERDQDMFAAIDKVLDKMHRQITRYKDRRRRKGERGAAPGEKPIVAAAEATLEEVEESSTSRAGIVRVKRFPTTMMDPEEAIEQMELLGHDFFVFFNAESESINVAYRRRDGNYGLLQPEIG